MKLRTLAIAVAMAAVPFAAQADLKISGDVGARYNSGTEVIEQFGSEVNFDASEKVGGITYGGHLGLQYGEGGGASLDEGRVYAEGGFGKVVLGHHDNGCNTVDIGGTNDWLGRTHKQGGCEGASDNNILYTRAMGPASVALSHNPGADESTIGVAGSFGPVGISVGYEDLAAGDSNVVLGLTGKIGPVSVGFRANEQDSVGDAVHGINFLYSRGGHNIYGGAGTSDNNDEVSLGYKRVIGNTDIGFEWNDDDAGGDGVNLGMRHRF